MKSISVQKEVLHFKKRFANRSRDIFGAVDLLSSKDETFAVPIELELKSREMVSRMGMEDAAKTLGFDISDRRNLIMAGRLVMMSVLMEAPSDLIEYVDVLKDRLSQMMKDYILSHCVRLQDLLNAYEWANFRFEYFGACTMRQVYLMKTKYQGPVRETPTQMYMRLAVQFYHADGIDRVEKAFREMAEVYYTPASPTIFNAGTVENQMSSCFVMTIEDDMEDISYKLGDCGIISKHGGGIGFDVSCIRHSEIKMVGMSNGVVPMLRNYNNMMRYADQGGKKRKGAATVFLRPHHIDVEDFIRTVDKVGDPNDRTHDLNNCLFNSWLFFQRVRENGPWTLFCPSKTPQLNEVYGRDFERLYLEAEADPTIKYKKTIKARDLLNSIISMQIKASMPFMVSGDSMNFKSAHKHIGTIKSSNLCVAGTTKILTSKGTLTIGQHVGEEVEVWNGDRWSRVTIEKTSGDRMRPLLVVTLDDGSSLTCTPGHLFLIRSDRDTGKPHLLGTKHPEGYLKDQCRRVAAGFLMPGMELEICQLPVVPDIPGVPFLHAYTHAVFCMLGRELRTEDDTIRVMELTPEQEILKPCLEVVEADGVLYLPEDLKPIYKVPLNASYRTKLEWLAGLFDAGARMSVYTPHLYLNSHQLTFLIGVQHLFHSLGIRARILDKSQAVSFDGGHHQLQYNQYTLAIESGYVSMLEQVKIPCRRFSIPSFKGPHTVQPQRVVSVTSCDLMGPTFCFKEPFNHTGVFNGILTGQCLEITEYTDRHSINVCNLSSIDLSKISRGRCTSPPADAEEAIERCDFSLLSRVTVSCVQNLNRVIDNNFYPLDRDRHHNPVKGPASTTNKRFRAIGLGVQGLTNLFADIDLPYVSNSAARKLDEAIFACIYYNALVASVQLAITEGKNEVFEGSPFSEGKLQFDLWQEEYRLRWGEHNKAAKDWDFSCLRPLAPSVWKQSAVILYDRFGKEIDRVRPDWDEVRRVVMKYGMRNSMLTAQMPTASSSIILMNNESVEAPMRNLYTAKNIAGDYIYLNHQMARDLEEIGLWNTSTAEQLVKQDGKLSGLEKAIRDKKDLFPGFDWSARSIGRLEHLISKYKTMWEIPQREVMWRAAKRGLYIDQSQSMSLFREDPDIVTMAAAFDYADRLGLKTQMYYLRMKPASTTAQFSLKNEAKNDKTAPEAVCTDEVCISCQ